MRREFFVNLHLRNLTKKGRETFTLPFLKIGFLLNCRQLTERVNPKSFRFGLEVSLWSESSSR